MFLRVRGMGASPENSQAAVMHVRGFRLSNSPPPVGFYLSAHISLSDRVEASGSATKEGAVKEITGRVAFAPFPYRYPHFGVGIHAPSILKAQRAFSAWLASRQGNIDMSAWDGHSGEGNAVIWKETWNAYDILYDDAMLFPDSFDNVNESLSRLASLPPVGDESAEKTTAAVLQSADHGALCFARAMDGFVLLGDRVARQKTVVCTHYYGEQLLPNEVFSESRVPVKASEMTSTASLAAVSSQGSATTLSHVPPRQVSLSPDNYAPIIVCDLSLLDRSSCGSKLAVELAWLLAFTTLLPDNVLGRSGMVVIRLPYDMVPSAQALAAAAAGEGGGVAGGTTVAGESAMRACAKMTREAMDFMGEHVALAHRGITAGLPSSSASPAVMCIGAKEDVLYTSLRQVLQAAPSVAVSGKDGHALDSEKDSGVGKSPSGSVTETRTACGEQSNGDAPKLARVIYLIGDHVKYDAQADVTCRKDAEERFAARCGASVQFLEVPLKSLIEGEEEAWDAYTQRENARLNYCPCCSHCSHDHT